MAHRLAFLYIEGYFPEDEIDHIDKNPANNKWGNLRTVRRSCNLQNRDLQVNNKTSVSGVLWYKRYNKWCSIIGINKKRKFLGYFDNFDDAVFARYNEEVLNEKWTCSTSSPAYIYLKNKGLI